MLFQPNNDAAQLFLVTVFISAVLIKAEMEIFIEKLLTGPEHLML